MQKVEQKLHHYQKYLKNQGFSSVNLEIILREKTESHLVFETDEDLIFPNQFSDFIPMGNPPSFMVGYGILGSEVYVSIFKSQDTAVKLQLKGVLSPNLTNPIEIMHIIKETLEKILIETRDEVEVLDLKIQDKTNELNYELFSGLQEMSAILYSFLTSRPIIIVGKIDESVNLLKGLLTLLPSKFRQNFSFTINIPKANDYNPDFVILDMVPQYQLETEVNKFLSEGYSLINLFTKECFAEFSCKYTTDIVESIIENRSLESAQRKVKHLLTLVKEVEDGENSTNFADRNNINFDNAELVVDMADTFMEV